MKKLLFALVLCAGCSVVPQKKITSVEPLPEQQKCLYSVQCDSAYTFIDECDKYKVGQVID